MKTNEVRRIRRSGGGFTLLELLMVIGIIGVLAAVSVPVMRHFRPGYTATVTKQLLDDLARARQLAISQRTTVYMVFVRSNFWNDAAVSAWRAEDWQRATNLQDKQLVGYAFAALKSLGDQPGRPNARYLSPWRTLPEGGFLALQKFDLPNRVFTIMTNNLAGSPVVGFTFHGLNLTTSVPFPLADTPKGVAGWVTLPYVAFDYQGRLTPPGDEVLPIAQGTVTFARDPASKMAKTAAPTVQETPPGNAMDPTSYNVIVVDWLGGRARLETQEAR